ncbi:type II toxin-antitoxin system VapC family toxin [Mesorhizobium xinjiangense]|uniref:type II toxin-antitoxin system VapC family toxin n=1 Tax=Mesorhizobium xinjiangense TaxID=2678685 RepID=UPI0012ED0E6D|nr:type II toxin-antitoxin system VapC family toxin [Mesorhizobium xinjiangense]
MTQQLVVDASVAIKWVVPEDGQEEARALTRDRRLIAPQLIYAECANIVWKKVARGELGREEAIKAAQFIDTFEVWTVSMHTLGPLAVELALDLGHPVYDCFYLALAIVEDCSFVTADIKLHRKVHTRLPASDAIRCVMLEAFGPNPDSIRVD